MSSQITHTPHNHQHTPCSTYTYHLRFNFSSCALFTVHLTPLQVITIRAWEGCPKEHRAKQKWPNKTHSVTYVPGLSTLFYHLSIVTQPPPSFLCCPSLKATFTSSIQPNLVVSLIFTTPLLLPSTPFWTYSTYPFFPHAKTI